MKKLRKILVGLVIMGLCGIGVHLFYLSRLAAKEIYPDDSYLSQSTDKKALIIVAHDDDMVGSSGTIASLCRDGWNIREMCFYQLGGLYYKKDSAKNPVRKRDLNRVAVIQGLAGVEPTDFNFRKDMETEKSYMPFPYADFPNNYYVDSMLGYIGRYIAVNKPSVIFTLDDKIGGYGHPDHVLVSSLVLRYCQEHRSDPGFTVKRIYQAVFPPSLAEGIMKNMPVYAEAKKVYGVQGMPVPDVQVNISSFGSIKKDAMMAYTTEQNSLRQIWPYYHWYPGSIYFRIFDRDFFRVINLESM